MKYKPIPKGSCKLAAKVAVEILIETNNHFLAHGDGHYLHLVAEKLGWPPEGLRTEKRVLDSIDRYHGGFLIKRYFSVYRGFARIFYLPGRETFPGRPCSCSDWECKNKLVVKK